MVTCQQAASALSVVAFVLQFASIKVLRKKEDSGNCIQIFYITQLSHPFFCCQFGPIYLAMPGRWILAQRRCCKLAAPQAASLFAGVVQHTTCQGAMATLVLNGSVCCIRPPASPRFAPSMAPHIKCSGIVSQAIAETMTVIKNNTGGSDPTDNHVINGEPILA